MGSDYYMMGQEIARDRGASYRSFKTSVCRLLGMECEFDVTGPGDDRTPSDADVLAELERRL